MCQYLLDGDRFRETTIISHHSGDCFCYWFILVQKKKKKVEDQNQKPRAKTYKPRGRPKTTYLQLKEKHFQTLEDAMIEAKDRERWRAVVQDPSFLADKGQQ